MISLTVGGGYGFLTGRYGLTIDNLVGATVVVADGRVLQVSKEENQDVSFSPASNLSPETPRDIQDLRPASSRRVPADKLALLCHSRWGIKLRHRHQVPICPSLHSTHLLVGRLILYRG